MTASTKTKPDALSSQYWVKEKRYSNGDRATAIFQLYLMKIGVNGAQKAFCVTDKEVETMRFVTIEVQLDSDDQEAHDTIIEAAREAAQLLRAQAGMLSGRHGPNVTLKSWKMFEEEMNIPLDILDTHSVE